MEGKERIVLGTKGLHPPQTAQLVGCSLTSPMGTVLAPESGVSRQVGSEKFMSYSYKPKCTHEV